MKRLIFLGSLFLLSCLFMIPTGPSVMAQGEEFVIVVNPAVPGNSITEAILKGIYLRDMKRWSSSDAVIQPVDIDGDVPLSTSFHSKIFNKSPKEMKAYWLNLRLSKNVMMPASEKSCESAVKYVAKTAGAIAYVRPSAVDSSVKILKIEN